MSNVEEPLTSPSSGTSGTPLSADIRPSDAVRQTVASCVSFTLVIQVGASMSYSSVLLPQLREQAPAGVPLDTDQESWIAGLVTLVIPVASLLAGPLMDKYGRRKLSALSGLPFALGWLVVAVASRVCHLYVGRILAGVGAGFSTVCLVYCSELTHPAYRPMLLGLNSVFVSLGILVTCSLGMQVSWRVQAIIYCTLSLLTVALHWPLPESPHWLENAAKAEDALAWLYRRPEVYRVQLAALRHQRQHRTHDNAITGLAAYLQPAIRRPVFLLAVIFLFQQLTGAYIVIFYAVNIFRELQVRYEELLLVMFGAIRFLMAVVSLLLSRVLGRRKLLCASGVGMCLSCLTAFVLLQMDAGAYGVGPCVLAHVCFGALGFLGIPWTLIGELFPVRVKGVVSGIMITVAYAFMFATVKTFPLFLRALHIDYVFLAFSVNSLLAVAVVFIWLPETLGVTFSDIEKHFS